MDIGTHRKGRSGNNLPFSLLRPFFFFFNWGIISCSETHTFYRSAYHEYIHTYADLCGQHWNQEQERFRYSRKFCRAPFQAAITHRGPVGLLPITVDSSTSSRTSSKWDHGTFSVSVRYPAPFAFHEAMLSPVSTDHPFLFLRATLWYEYTTICPSILLTDTSFGLLWINLIFEHTRFFFFWTPTLSPPRVEFLGHSVGYDSFHCHMIFFFLASSFLLLFCFGFYIPPYKC